MVKKLLSMVLIVPLAGCSWWPSIDLSLGRHLPCTVFSDDGTHGFEPNRGASSRWTEGEQRQLAALNETGAARCGWTPPGGR